MVELQLHPIPYPRELLDRAQQDIKFASSGQRASGRVRSSTHEPRLAFWVLKSGTTSFRVEGRRDRLHRSELRQPRLPPWSVEREES